jgi:hypothetical protein
MTQPSLSAASIAILFQPGGPGGTGHARTWTWTDSDGNAGRTRRWRKCRGCAQGGQDFIALHPRLNDKIAYLATVVGMADSGPTKQSHDSFNAVAAEADKQLGRLEGIVGQDLRAVTLYVCVREAGVAPITPAQAANSVGRRVRAAE